MSKENAAMKGESLFSRVRIGVSRRPARLLASIFLVYATTWAVLEPVLGLMKPAEAYLTGWPKYLALILVSVLIGLLISAVPRELIVRLGNSVVHVTFGDLFATGGLKAIPVSRFFFETEVVATSLQGTVIRRFMQSREGAQGLQEYENALSAALEGKHHEELLRAATQKKEKYYPLGTTAMLELQGDPVPAVRPDEN